jgi:hypothetical protein
VVGGQLSARSAVGAQASSIDTTKYKRLLLRLCRPMCGRAMPFRECTIDFGERLCLEPAAVPRRRSLRWQTKPVGKAKPYRTSGGRAAKQERGLAHLDVNGASIPPATCARKRPTTSMIRAQRAFPHGQLTTPLPQPGLYSHLIKPFACSTPIGQTPSRGIPCYKLLTLQEAGPGGWQRWSYYQINRWHVNSNASEDL